MKYKRTFVALAAAAAVSTVGFASASQLGVSGTIQYGHSDVSCDNDGVHTNWGLETKTNTVSFVRITDIAAECAGSDLFVQVNNDEPLKLRDSAGTQTPIGSSGSERISLPTPMNPGAINNVRVWIEG